jgi:uncharacterized protein YjdB
MKRFFKLMANTLAIAAFAAVILVSCKKDPDPVVQVSSVTVAPSTLSIKVGEKSQLTFAVAPEDAADKSLQWHSSVPTVAAVSATGEVTAIAVGTTTVSATATNGVNGTSTITVVTNIVNETGVSINVDADTLQLVIEDTRTLTATVVPENATNRSVIWLSNDPRVAAVNLNSGLVTATGPGIAKIVAMTDRGFTDTCVVQVSVPLTDIDFDTTYLVLKEDVTRNLVARPVPANATDYNPVWTSSNTDVATVTQDGLLTTVAEGNAVITVASGSISLRLRITVNHELPKANLFDFVIDADGVAHDVSPNGLEIIEGPATKWQRENKLETLVQWNATLDRYEAVIYTPMSQKYPDNDPLFPGWDFSEYADVTYTDYRHTQDPNRAPDKLGSNYGMGFYKIPWADNEAMYQAYINEFSYEIVFMVPEKYNGTRHAQGQYLFGNVNPNHSGFGIKLNTSTAGMGDPIEALIFNRWGNTNTTSLGNVQNSFEYGKYYHVVLTYDRNDPRVSKVLYIDGIKISEDTDHIFGCMHLPVDYFWGEENGMRGEPYVPGRTPRQPWMENLWIGGIANQSGWPETCWGPNKTHYAIARVYDKSLSAAEVYDLFEASVK